MKIFSTKFSNLFSRCFDMKVIYFLDNYDFFKTVVYYKIDVFFESIVLQKQVKEKGKKLSVF